MLIAGNWKLYKGPAETREFCHALRETDLGTVDVVVCPPYVSLAEAVTALAMTEIGVAAQNVHWADDGAFTGEKRNQAGGAAAPRLPPDQSVDNSAQQRQDRLRHLVGLRHPW